MKKKIFKSTMLVMCITLVLGLTFVMGILYRHFGKQLQVELNKEAAYLSSGVDLYGVDYLTKVKNKDSRITYIEADGTVIYDNQADASSMENHSDREEVKKALKYGVGNASRMSNTLKRRLYTMRYDWKTDLFSEFPAPSILCLHC